MNIPISQMGKLRPRAVEFPKFMGIACGRVRICTMVKRSLFTMLLCAEKVAVDFGFVPLESGLTSRKDPWVRIRERLDGKSRAWGKGGPEEAAADGEMQWGV